MRENTGIGKRPTCRITFIIIFASITFYTIFFIISDIHIKMPRNEIRAPISNNEQVPDKNYSIDIKKPRIEVQTPASSHEQAPDKDYLFFQVKLNSERHGYPGWWYVRGDCFDPADDSIYSNMHNTDVPINSFTGYLDELAKAKGYCFFYIHINAIGYLPNHYGKAIYPPVDFQKKGIPKREAGQEEGILGDLSVRLISHGKMVLLPVTVIRVVGDKDRDPGWYKAGSLVFRVKIPKEGKK
ncbi:hypothetical protein JW977_01290 [Candidatus Falkowbacteria bacterium]|nr:hypothetical protein [Candidatus Falkowbacteria bacterium]